MSKQQQGATNAIILNEKNEILLTKRSEEEDFLPGYWELAGGGIDYGETPQEGLSREIMEECGIEIEIIKPVAANTYFIKELQRIEITFLCKAVNPKDLKLNWEHSDFKWLKVKDIYRMKISDYVRDIIKSVEFDLP